ncbi:MAG: hypothetical protein M3Y42_18960 [Actinomycetota bacterium]|nr:hypothetical protein [Actinomycetota bacterium]MDQ2959025.1 hypothetical protein [Actinomycetota bacterium]
MKLKSIATSLFVTALTASALTLSPVAAQATQIPNPNTQYQLATYHAGSIHGEVIGQYAYAGPCGDAFWWGDTSVYVTTSWVTCPGH